jgi:hypothetical protein
MKRTLLLTPLFLLVLPAAAQSVKVDMAPGLWENKISYTGDGATQMQQVQSTQIEAALAEMKKQFAAMPAEQRKQMEALMAQSDMEITEQGMSFENNQVSFSPEGITAKSCVTQAQIDSGDMGMDDRDECSASLTQVSKNHFKSVQVCTGDNPSRNESEIVFSSPKRFSGTGYMTRTVNGIEHKVSLAVEGTWQGSNCGDIQPK